MKLGGFDKKSAKFSTALCDKCCRFVLCWADYWVSQARKFCDFCKCWIADNKPSIQSHENGKRHKEAVAQRISQMTKQSVKEKNESLKIDEEMKKMEEAAMKAYLKDVESNPDYTSQVIKETVSEARKMKETKKDEEPPIVTPPEITTKKHTKENVSNKKVKETNEKETEWYEAQSDEGYTYYWNYNTGESIWEAPPEGYVSIEEQTKASKEVENEGTNKITSESVKKKEPSEKEQPKINKRKIEEKEEDLAPLDVGMGPSCKPDPYGKWKTVETRIQEPIDYQLPQQDFVEIKVPTITEPEIKFKEKKITSIDDAAGPTTFKKRKFGARGNARQRFDDD